MAWVCFYGLVVVGSEGPGTGAGREYVLLFMLFPQIWAYLSTRRAVVATIIVIVWLAVIAIGHAGWNRQTVGEVAAVHAAPARAWRCCSGCSSPASSTRQSGGPS